MARQPDARTLARRQRVAWIVAIAADALQLAAMPLFVEGWLSPANDVLDVVTSLVLFRLLGWHPALLPSLAAELLPGLDLVPTWTAAVGIVAWTRRVRGVTPAHTVHTASSAEVVPDGDPGERTHRLPPQP